MDDGRHRWELAPEHLRRTTNPATLGFETTAVLPAPQRLVGQMRAEDAINFALEIADPRYNLYVSGPPGTGRVATLLSAVERVAKERSAADDWVYVFNFEQPNEPRALRLPAGTGRAFARDVEHYVLACRRELRRAFSDESYGRQRDELMRSIEARHAELLDGLQRDALALGFLLRGTPSGLAVIPIRLARGAGNADASAVTDDGDERGGTAPQPLPQEEFAALPPEEQQHLRDNHDAVQSMIDRVLPQVRELEEQARARIRRLDRAVANAAINHLTEDIVAAYAYASPVTSYISLVKADVVAHADVLHRGDDEEVDADDDQGITDTTRSGSDADERALDVSEMAADDEAVADDQVVKVEAEALSGSQSGAVPLDEGLRARPALSAVLRRYLVNVLVAHASKGSAPVIQEINPTYAHLVGRIDFGLRNGMPYTDHLMIRAGALHRANGGFLILQARDLASQAGSWDAVKRMVRFGHIVAEGGSETQGMPTSASLRPEAIPMDVKVILVGDMETYETLDHLDPEFRQLFKVRADFEADMPRTTETERYYAHFAGDIARCADSPPATNGAVALLIEEGSRWAEDQHRLTALMGDVRDLVTEACYWAKKESATATTRLHMAKAIAGRERRVSMVSDRMDQEIYQGSVVIDTEGTAIGQVNGLVVRTIAEHAFGKPTRITARTSPGWAGVVNIEREIEMSGPSHSKGIFILAGYLAGRYAHDMPLSLSASLCFEQQYGGVDGDSASSAELYALLSSLCGLPLRQSLAVTGSVNQRGEVQAVGGVTQKVEGFYRICRARGLTGQQGVILPRTNVRNLMLREEIVEAVQAGQFHLYAVSTVDEGIELLTGIPAGKPDPTGRYLEGTVNARVIQALHTYSERVRAAGPASVTVGRMV